MQTESSLYASDHSLNTKPAVNAFIERVHADGEATYLFRDEQNNAHPLLLAAEWFDEIELDYTEEWLCLVDGEWVPAIPLGDPRRRLATDWAFIVRVLSKLSHAPAPSKAKGVRHVAA